ncbi:MAG: MarC family protein [Chlamydiales bacterium]|nr:MarC family protein [Chlamydiales bacterium]
MSELSIIVALFVILNAIGNVPIFIALLKDFDQRAQKRIIVRELFFALLIMLIFSFGGEAVLSFLNLNISVLRIGGGVILALIALEMIFPKPMVEGDPLKQEPFIVPLSIPIMAGPGTISNVMIFSLQESNHWVMFLCILAAWFPSLCVLLLSSYLQKLVGEKVLKAFERFAGMVLMFIAVQMMTTGANEYIKNLSI